MFKTGVLKQFLATIICNLLTFNYGTIGSWGARNFILLSSKDSPLSRPLSIFEASFVVSIIFFGAIFGLIVYTIFMNRCSRIILLISVAILQLLSWLVLLLTSNIVCLYAARFLTGIAGGGAVKVVGIYVAEFADDSVRGTLNSMLNLSMNAGYLFGLVIADYLDYYGQIKTNIIIPSLFLILFKFFLDIPVKSLMKRNQQNPGEKSENNQSKNNSSELENRNIDKHEKAEETNDDENNSLSLSDFCNPAAKKAIIIALVLVALNQLSGALTMENFATKIFEDAGSSLPSGTSSIIVGAVQLFSNMVAMVLVDYAGRKCLMILSTCGTAMGLIGMGLYELYKEHLDSYRWIPIASFSTVTFMSSIGLLPLTYVILSEILPPKIRNAVSFGCLELLNILAFALTSVYPILTQEIGAHSCMFIFAGFCLFGVVFHSIVLPETKGKSIDEIIKTLDNSNNDSQK